MTANQVNLEKNEINRAYLEEIQVLYDNLVSNLVDMKVTGTSEEEVVADFRSGLAFARRARDLALVVVEAEV